MAFWNWNRGYFYLMRTLILDKWISEHFQYKNGGPIWIRLIIKCYNVRKFTFKRRKCCCFTNWLFHSWFSFSIWGILVVLHSHLRIVKTFERKWKLKFYFNKIVYYNITQWFSQERLERSSFDFKLISDRKEILRSKYYVT